MTAIEWLYKTLHEQNYIYEDMSEYLKQAKEMEKQQIINAHFSAQMEDLQFWNEAKQEALDYYNETFKNTEL